MLTEICDGAGSTCGGSSTIRARGFLSNLPWDSFNHKFLYWGGNTNNDGIYSNAISPYNPTDHTFSETVDNGGTATANCGQSGAPYDTFNPILGHPQGTPWTDGTYAYMTGQLCQGQFSGFTNRYALTTQSMTSRLSVAPFGTGDGTFNATFANFQKIEYLAEAAKSYYCCWDGGAGVKFVEFAGGTYTDKTSSLSGDALPAILTGHGMVSLGGYLWVFGGCLGSSPGNNGDCSGTPSNDLYRISPTYVVTKMAPSGTPPTTTYTSHPFIAADTARLRIMVYSDTNTLLAYSLTDNAWMAVTLSGDTGLTMPTGTLGSGNLAGYDPDHNRMVLMTSRGQSFTPQVQEIQFPPAALVLSGSITFSGALTLR